jgi:hypothetical protein
VWTGAPAAAGLPAEPCKTVSPDFLEDVAPQAGTGEPGDSARRELEPGTWIVACSRSEYPLLVGFTYHEAFSDLDDDRAACATAPPSGRIAVPSADIACITYSDDVMAALAVGAHHSLYIAVPDPSASSDVVAAELARLWKLWARAT